MKKVMPSAQYLLSFLCFVFLVACSDKRTKVRFINAVPDSPELTIVLEGSKLAQGLAYTEATELTDVSASSRILSIKRTSDNDNLITFQLDFEEDVPITFGLIGDTTHIQAVRLEETDSTPIDGKARLRIWNLAPNLPQPADVYVNEATVTDIDDKTANFEDLNLKIVTSFLDLDPGEYRVRLTAPDDKTPVADKSITLKADQVSLLVAFDAAGGGTPVSLVRFNQ